MKSKNSVKARLLNVPDYAGYVFLATGTVYNQISDYFRTGSTGGLFARPLKVGAKRRGVRFDKAKVDRNLDDEN